MHGHTFDNSPFKLVPSFVQGVELVKRQAYITSCFSATPPRSPKGTSSSIIMHQIRLLPDPFLQHRPLLPDQNTDGSLNVGTEPVKFNPDNPRYRFMCNRLHVRMATGIVTVLETLWIFYQFVKILVCYIRNPTRYTEIFLPTFVICLFSSLAVGILISAVVCQKANRLIPYMVLNILCISSLIACILVSIMKLVFGYSHPKLASMASSVVPSFEVIFYSNESQDENYEQILNMDVRYKMMLLIIILSSILVLIKSLFLKILLAYYHFLKDLEASIAPVNPLTAVFCVR